MRRWPPRSLSGCGPSQRRRPRARDRHGCFPTPGEIGAWLPGEDGEARGLRLAKVHQLLARPGVEVPYSSLHRFG
jgi:hypothetical protein